MTCRLTAEEYQEVVAFHGHSCPGLAIGVRVSELARRELGPVDASELVAVAETDMCGVDAIQFLTGCTLGKGNFIHRDYGKTAFSFYDRSSGRAFRAVFRPEARSGVQERMDEVSARLADGSATAQDRERLAELRGEMLEQFLKLPLDEMFTVQALRSAPPRPAQVLATLVCDGCGEGVMESRSRRWGGQTFCIPCFAEREQKI
ncbi:MAG: FmdE family protein [Desulfovibrio sp.]|jgi:formylmethanofuran dehydrogenase subunit E